MVTPQRARTASTKSALLGAIRNPAVPTAAIAATPFCLASSAMAAIASIVRSIGSGLSRPVSWRPSPSRVTSARSTTVRQAPSAPPLADVELHRVRADVDDRVPPLAEPDERLEAAREAHVRPRGQPEAHAPSRSPRVASSDSIAMVRVDAPGAHLGQLRHAAADRVPLPPLVHLDREQVGVRTHHLVQELARACMPTGGGASGIHTQSRSTEPTSAAESGNAAFITGSTARARRRSPARGA